MHLNKSLTVIVATACLHNFAMNNGQFFKEEVEESAHLSTGNNASSATTSGNIRSQQFRLINKTHHHFCGQSEFFAYFFKLTSYSLLMSSTTSRISIFFMFFF